MSADNFVLQNNGSSYQYTGVGAIFSGLGWGGGFNEKSRKDQKGIKNVGHHVLPPLLQSERLGPSCSYVHAILEIQVRFFFLYSAAGHFERGDQWHTSAVWETKVLRPPKHTLRRSFRRAGWGKITTEQSSPLSRLH